MENQWTMEERKWKVNEEWKWQHLGNGVSPGTGLWPCPSLPNILGRISAQKFGGEQFPVPRLPILPRCQKLASHPNERVQRGKRDSDPLHLGVPELQIHMVLCQSFGAVQILGEIIHWRASITRSTFGPLQKLSTEITTGEIHKVSIRRKSQPLGFESWFA